MFGCKRRELIYNMKKKNYLSYIILSILAFICAFPLYTLVINSFKDRKEIFSDPLALPTTWKISNFTQAWQYGNYGQAMKNSLFITVLTVMMVVLVAGFAAYALQKNTRFSRTFIIYFMACTAVPVQLFLIPLYGWFQKLHLGNPFGVSLIYTALYSPFSILLLRSYLISVPPELEEASKIDGASKLQYYTKILLPIVKPAFLTIALIVTYWAWGEFVVSTTFLTQSPEQNTLIVKFFTLSGRYSAPWGLIMASGIIISLPIICLFIFFQKYFIKGLAAGSIK